MAPGGGRGGEKRKRPDRTDSGDGNRPSPHRPGNADLIRRDQGEDRNGRRPSRGGGRGDNNRNSRGRGDGRRESAGRMNNNDPNHIRVQPRQQPQGRMSPPIQRPSSASQLQQAPLTPIATPVSKVSTPEPLKIKREIVPHAYTILTDTRISDWATTGRREVVAAGLQAILDEDEFELSVLCQEFLRAGLDERFEAASLGSCLKDILEPNQTGERQLDGPRIFLDSLSVMMETEAFDSSLQSLISAANIPEPLMRQLLDAPLLQSLGLTRPTFIKAGIRQVTNLLYRQANHNLLREETEGYSKLVTELFTTSATTTGSEPQAGNIAEETFERVKGLIGTFDLDVGRVLDVTLDVFAAVLIKQFRFFIKLLRISSWWPRDTGLRGLQVPGYNDTGLPHWALPGSTEWQTREEDEKLSAPARQQRDSIFWQRAREIGIDAFFELGGRRAIAPEAQKTFLNGRNTDSVDQNATLEWIQATGTIPPAGNRVAAQLLGFKLRFYTSPARDKEDVLPDNLIYLAALLIKVGFISLRDLYPHLWPLDEDMEAVKTVKVKELAEKERANRPGGANNALLMAGALADDTLPPPSRTREATAPKANTIAPTANADATTQELSEPKDQKVILLSNLLTIGAIPEALFILGKFPWIPEAFPETYDLIHRILHHSMDKVFEDGQIPAVDEHAMPAKKATEIDQSLPQKFRQVDPPTRKPLRWPFGEKFDENGGVTYRFYWDEWADNVPVCQDVDDIFTLCSTFLNISGVNIGRDASLLAKLASIGSRSLAKDHSEDNLARWQDLLKRLLVPALSLTKANTSIVNEIYDMLRYYSAPIRYNIYAEWFEGQISRLPAMQAAFSRARLETLSTMKRISKTNLTTMARALAKTAYASPGIVFKVALDQIEAYSNLTEVVVECAKYFTDLGYDVLLWSLMSSLGGQSRSRTRSDDALLTSRWLIALSNFSGKVFKRYSIMDPAPILQYVNDQLHRGNSTDLIILEQLIAQMSGIVSDNDFTDAQLLAMTGGSLLRKQTLINLQDKRYESEKTTKRLMQSLIKGKLAGQILIATAQHKQSAIYAIPEDEAHIKYMATVIDDTQRILFQYLDLLRSNLSVEDFDALVPDTGKLMNHFKLEPSLAFLLGRASFSHRLAITNLPVASPPATNRTSKLDIDGDALMTADEILPLEDDIEKSVAARSDATAIESTLNANESSTEDLSLQAVLEPWREQLAPLVDAVRQTLPPGLWEILDPVFYAVFWQLSLSDIHMPMDSYLTENARIGKEIQRASALRQDSTRKALETTRDDLMKESKQVLMKYERSKARLNKEKGEWFTRAKGKYDEMSHALWQECLIPRLLLSPSDADYCFRMIKFFHNTCTPHFRTVSLLDKFFVAHRLRTLIFSCTIREAENLGRFVKLILIDMTRWHASKVVYEKEALGNNKDLPGFARKLDDNGKPASSFSHEEFRTLLFKWHKNLNTALRACLTGTEWMHIRNGITVLKGVVEVFPVVDFMGKLFQETLAKIGEKEKDVRDDLSLTANALLPELKKRQSKWVRLQGFATNIGDSGAQSNGAKSGTPQPEIKSALKPTAAEFKPQLRDVSHDKATQEPSTADVEDGEVDDAKKASLASANAIASEAKLSSVAARGNTDNGGPSSRGSTPKPDLRNTQSRSSSHADPLRNTSNVALPVRPEVPIPPHSELERHRSRLDGRGEDLNSRQDRTSDTLRDRYRETSRRGTPDVSSPVPGRSGDKFGSEREDFDPRRRDTRRGLRDSRESRDVRDANRLPMDSSRNDLLPRRDMEARSNGLATTPSSFAPSDRSTHLDPGRAALIDRDVPRSSRDISDGRGASKPHSPRGDRQAERDERFSSTANHTPIMDRRDRQRDEAMPTPSGPRGERMNDRGPQDRSRDASAFSATQFSSSNDPDHGRLSRPQSDLSYGRLNPALETLQAPPSGPRGREGRNAPGSARNSSGPIRNAEGRDNRLDHQQPPPVDNRGPPTGPSTAGRALRAAPLIPSSPLTPAQTTPLPGMHPSRVMKFDEPQASPATPHNGPAVHPSRLGNVDPPVRPHVAPVQTNNVPSGPSIVSPHNSGPPSGPRGGRNIPSTSMPSPVATTPTGPSSSNDSGRGDRRRFQGLQNIISASPGAPQQSNASPGYVNDRVMSIKGRGRPGTGGNNDMLHANVPPSPPGPPPSSADPSRQDSAAESRGTELINPDRLNRLRDATNPRDEQKDRDDRSGGRGRESIGRHSERGGRGSRRSSRDRSPRRDRSERAERSARGAEDAAVADRGGPPRDSRGGRSGRDGDRDGRDRRHGSDRDREKGQGEENRAQDRDGGRSRDQPPVRDENAANAWQGGRAGGMDERGDRRVGRGETRNGEARRDSRARGAEDGGGSRKRTSQEGGNGMGSDREKRPRR